MPELDALIHQPTRLRLILLLSGVEETDFGFLASTLGLTNGNLSTHATRLEEAGYLQSLKRFEGRIPNTTYRITAVGKQRLEEYWLTLDEMRRSAGRTPEPAPDSERKQKSAEVRPTPSRPRKSSEPRPA
jgi:DNA-binding transcriptional ArsR family regulator